MEDELKEACEDYAEGRINLRGFKQALKSLLEQAQDTEMLEFAQTVLEGLREEKGH